MKQFYTECFMELKSEVALYKHKYFFEWLSRIGHILEIVDKNCG